MTHLGRFLIRLAREPEAMAALRKDPIAAMRTAHLTEDEIELVKRADPAELRKAISGEPTIMGDTVVVVAVVVVIAA